MLERWTCVQGHAWEAEAATVSPRCPECGLPPDPGAFADAEDVPAPVPAPPPLGDAQGKPVVVGYEIVADRGKSPAGVRLYRARQLVAGREVLLEVVLAREDSGQRAWNALRGEASGHAKLSHPHIVQLYEAGERDRQLFYNAMEYVDGPTLDEATGDEPVPVAQALALVELLARAVAYANGLRQIHRHLEPNAVLLQRVPAPEAKPARANPGGGVCRIRDEFFIPRIRGFGLARRPVENDILDIDLYADAGYLSPEQSWGKGQELGPHTDVYGLGGILYYLLTGRPPFRGPTQEDVVDAIQTAALVKPSEIRRTPPVVTFVCRAALARRVSRRYSDCTELADDLRRVANDYPPETFNASYAERLGFWRKRRPGLAALLLMGVLCVASTLIAYAVGGSDEPSRSRRVADVWDRGDRVANDVLGNRLREVKAWQGTQDYRDFIRTAARLAATDKDAARAALDSGRTALDAVAASERGFEWHYLDRLLEGEEKTTIPWSRDATAFAFYGTEGKELAVARTIPDEDESSIRVHYVASGEERLAVAILASPVRRMAYLENGTLAVLAGTRPGRLCLVEGDKVTGLEDTVPSPSLIGTGGTGNHLLVMNEAGDLRTHDANNARPFGPARSLLGDRFAKTASLRLALLPNRLGVALADADGEGVFLYSEARPLTRLEGCDEKVECMVSDHAGGVAIATREKRITFAEQFGQIAPPPFEGGKGDVKRMAFSPDGKRLAVAYADGTLLVLGFVPPRPEVLRFYDKPYTGRWAELLTIPASGVRGLEFAPGGKALAAAGPKGVVVLGAWK